MRIFYSDQKVNTGEGWECMAFCYENGYVDMLPDDCQSLFKTYNLDPLNSIFLYNYNRFRDEYDPPLKSVVLGGLFLKQVMDGNGQFGTRVMGAYYNKEEKDLFVRDIKTSLEWSINWQKRNHPLWSEFDAHIIGFVFMEIDVEDVDFMTELIPNAEWQQCDNGRLRYYFGKRAESVDDYKGRFKGRE